MRHRLAIVSAAVSMCVVIAPGLLAQEAPPESARPVAHARSTSGGEAAASGNAVVLPMSMEATEGASTEGTALGGFSNTAQIVYGADLLAEAGIEAGETITALAFRVNTAHTAPAWSVTDYQIRLATSLNPPGSLDPNFVLNRGADYAVVRSGPLSYDGSEYSAGAAPNEFGPPIEFDQSFTYAGGDLLLEYTHTTVSAGGSFADAHEPDARMQSQFAPGFDGTVEGFGGQGVDRGTVVQLTLAAGCPEDLDLDGEVGVSDLLAVLGGWGSAAGDVTGDGTTDVADLLAVLSAWGAC